MADNNDLYLVGVTYHLTDQDVHTRVTFALEPPEVYSVPTPVLTIAVYDEGRLAAHSVYEKKNVIRYISQRIPDGKKLTANERRAASERFMNYHFN